MVGTDILAGFDSDLWRFIGSNIIKTSPLSDFPSVKNSHKEDAGGDGIPVFSDVYWLCPSPT